MKHLQEHTLAIRLKTCGRFLYYQVGGKAGQQRILMRLNSHGQTSQKELQDDGTDGQQPYLRLAVHGHAWLTCQRCMTPYDQTFDVDMTYRVVATEEEAEEFPLDDDEADVIVGSRQFDLVDLIEEELLLSLPLVSTR